MPPIAFDELTRARADTLPKSQTVFFFPVGPLEEHGPHLRMSLDLDEARWLCLAAAERLEKEKPGWVGVIMPAAPLGVNSDTAGLAIRVRAHVLRDWLVDACRSLARQGFSRFVCFSGHLGPRQLTAIEEAGKMLSWKGGMLFGPVFEMLLNVGAVSREGRPTLISASSALVTAADVKRAPLWPDPAEHAGKRDTSVALAMAAAFAPGASEATPGAGQSAPNPSFATLPPREREGSTWLARGILRVQGAIHGYWGDPARATAAEGERVLKEELDQVFPKLRAAWEGTNPSLLFRSWYSILPPNRSFFKSWMLTLGILTIFLAWLLLTIRGPW